MYIVCCIHIKKFKRSEKYMNNLPAYKALDVFWSIITLTRKSIIPNYIFSKLYQRRKL